MTRHLFIAAVSLLALAGCETQNQTLAAGTVAGAAVGNVVADDGNRTVGTLVGAAAGLGAAGIATEMNKPKQCIFRYPDGTERRGDCPPGF